MVTHVGHVHFASLTRLVRFSTFFSISMATHATACEVCVTTANEFHNMRHSPNKSIPVAKSYISTTAGRVV